MAILVSGGAGYIGSHTCVELLAAGYDIVVADNYYNSCPEALARVKKIAGKDFRFVEADMTDKAAVEKIFAENEDIDCVIQFAAYKAVGESVSKPIEYYSNNLACTLNILDVMRRHNCHNIIFSSSATVYGDPASVPIREDFPVGGTTNPYGTTKVFTERILTDCCKADPELNVALLRYFNPIGAHPSGLIGEDPNGIPNNLVPYIAKVAVGKLEKVHVFGNDYPTPDGTGVRDYIHVVDLARGHVAAIKKLVFDDKKYTLEQINEALKADFKGYEQIRTDCLNAPKYGNDDDYADLIAADLVNFTEHEHRKYKTLYSVLSHGTLSISNNTPFGQMTGASANGRHAWMPLSDGISPSQGADYKGPTAIIKSVSKMSNDSMNIGMVHNFKIMAGLLDTPQGEESLITLLRTACMLGNGEMQFNYLDNNTLIEAQKHPEQYRDLIVRVAGYSAFFVELCKDVQDEIISRTMLTQL